MSGGAASGTTVVDGGLVFADAGTEYGAIVSSGGLFAVFSNGVASDTLVLSRGLAGALLSGRLVGTTVESGGVAGALAGEADGTVIENGAGLADLGGIASNTTVESGGVLGIDNAYENGFGDGALVSTGSAVNTMVQSGGFLVPLSGTYVAGTVNDGGTVVTSGVFIANAFSGSVFYQTSAVNPSLGGFTLAYVLPGGVLSGGDLESPLSIINTKDLVAKYPSTVRVAPGGAVYGLDIGSGSEIANAGSAVGTFVNISAVDYVLAGGFDSGTAVSSGGKLDVTPGGTAVGATIASGGQVVAEDATAMIAGAVLAVGAQVVFADVVPSSQTQVSVGSGTLTLSDGTAADTRTVGLAGASAGLTVQVSNDVDTGGVLLTVESVACYCPGTLILTDTGEVPIERLQIGDHVVTNSGLLKPIRWIGRRSYSGRFIEGRHDMLPVRIRAGAIGAGVPRRDLVVSPKHAMLLDGVLVPAHCLVNGVSVTQADRVDSVQYVHVELALHDVILAEGAPSETFVDDNSRGMFHNAHEFAGRYPRYRRRPAVLLRAAGRGRRGAGGDQARGRPAGRPAAGNAGRRAARPGGQLGGTDPDRLGAEPGQAGRPGLSGHPGRRRGRGAHDGQPVPTGPAPGRPGQRLP